MSSIGHTRAMIKKSFGRSIDDLFEEFEEKLIASASVGQVHRARLRQRYAPRAIVEMWSLRSDIHKFWMKHL